MRPISLAYLRLTSLSVGAGPCWTWHSILVINPQWKRSSIVGMGSFMVFPTDGHNTFSDFTIHFGLSFLGACSSFITFYSLLVEPLLISKQICVDPLTHIELDRKLL